MTQAELQDREPTGMPAEGRHDEDPCELRELDAAELREVAGGPTIINGTE